MGTGKQRWTYRENPARFWRVLVIWTVVAVLVGALTATAINKAYSEPARADVAARCVTNTGEPCPTVTRFHKRVAGKYRNHKIAHAHGFSPKAIFRNPRASKRIIVRKMARAVARAEGRPFRRGDVSSCEYYGVRCGKIYDNLVSDAGCHSMASLDYGVYWSMCKERLGFDAGKLTKHQTQVAATVGVCGGQVVVGIVTSGASTAATAFIAGSAGLGCVVSLWTMLDP